MLASVVLGAADASSLQVRASKFELFVSDPADSIAFYSVLGFVVLHAKADGYTTLENGPAVISLSPLPWWLPAHWLGLLRSPPIGTEIVLYASDLERARASLDQAGYAPGAIVVQPWGDRDFRVTDPDGYYLRISEGPSAPPGR